MEDTRPIYESVETSFLIALHQVQDKIYGLRLTDNSILGFDMRDEKMRYFGRIPGVSIQTLKTFGSAVRYKDLTLYIPFRGADLTIYDNKTKNWAKVDLGLRQELEPQKGIEQREISNNIPGRFYGGCIYRDSVLLFPFGYKGFVRYDMDTGCVSHCADLSQTILKEDVALFHNFAWMDDTHIALSCFYSNHVVLFDLESNEVEIKTVGKKGCRFSTIVKHGKDYWLVVKNRLAFIRWDPETDEQEEYTVFPQGCEIANDKHCFDDSNIYVYDDRLYCFPAACNMAVKFDLTDRTAEEIKPLTKYCQDEKLDRRCSTFDGGIRVEDKIYLHYQADSILTFDLKTEEVHAHDRRVEDPDSIRRMQEDRFEMFCRSLYPGVEGDLAVRDRTVGEEIYGAISKLIL